jgi:hypothetical protein
MVQPSSTTALHPDVVQPTQTNGEQQPPAPSPAQATLDLPSLLQMVGGLAGQNRGPDPAVAALDRALQAANVLNAQLMNMLREERMEKMALRTKCETLEKALAEKAR